MATLKDRRPGARPASVSGASERLSRKEAARLWRDVTSGRTGIKRYYEVHGRRFLVLKSLSNAAQFTELSQRERRAMGYRAFGQSLRHIADELGVSRSTVLADLTSVRKRLGVATDLELPAILATGPRKVAVTGRGAKGTAKPRSIKLQRRDIWRQAFRAPRDLRREASRKATERLVLSFPISDIDWREGLSPAELSIAEDVLAGTDRSRIAARRGRTVRTISNQIGSIFRKLGVNSRLELRLYVLTGRYAVERRQK
jgi:DNA-binding NarL/FixJ family response regulator